MRAPTIQGRARVGINMTPMIDISFLLIIFFIVSSHLAQQEIQQELDLPLAASPERTRTDEARRLLLNVFDDGRIAAGADPIEAGDLERVIKAAFQKGGDDFEIRIRSDRRVAYKFIEPILLAATRVGVWNVQFAVIRREE